VGSALCGSPQLLNALPYTLAVAKETLRLQPVAATLRQGTRDFVFPSPDGAYLPTEGCAVITGTMGAQRRPDLWEQAQEFVPERWLVPDGDPLFPPKHGWRPFEAGPMNCIGQELAMMELKLVLVFTARELDIEPAWDKWDAKM
jgi:sterigmatocystin biosynthesis cytochrome P450 monooxygenase